MESLEHFHEQHTDQPAEKIAELLTLVLERREVVDAKRLEGTDRTEFMLQYLRQEIGALFPEFKSELDGEFEHAKEVLGDHPDRGDIARYFAAFVAAKTSLAGIEERLREYAVSHNNQEVVNRMVTYDVQQHELRLHVLPMFLDNPLALKKLFMEGLKVVADRLQHDASLAEVETVSGSSWIVYKHPDLLTRMGFKVTSRNENMQSATAKISKEDLIRLFS